MTVEPEKKVSFKTFRSRTKTWEELCDEAAEFAANKGRQRLISISHSQEGAIGLVIVWYWHE